MDGMGRSLVVIGLLIVAVGVFMSFGPRIPYIGRLPGDIFIKKENFTLYLPLTTSIVISVIVSLIIYLFRR